MKFFSDLFNRKKNKQQVGVISTTSVGNASWPERNYDNYAKETYLKNVIAFGCIDIIAKNVSSVPWELKRMQGEEAVVVEDHPIADILKRPNPQDSFNFLIYKYIAFLVMAGNSFMQKIGPVTGPNVDFIRELHVLRPNLIKVITDDNGNVTAYVYRLTSKQEPVTFKVDPITGQSDLLHIKFFNPLNDIWGSAITESAAREIDTSNEATEWNKKLLENEARPGMLFMFSGNLTDEQFDRLEKQLKTNYSGADNAGRNMILEGIGEGKQQVTPYGFSPSEMDFIESNRELARRICYAYRVPTQVLGIPGDSTFANFKEARAMLWEDTIMFYLNLLKGELNNWFFGSESDLFIDFNLEGTPAFALKQDLMWQRAESSNFLTVNEKRNLVNFEPVDGGDVLLVPANLLPISAAVETEEEIEQEEQETVDELVEEGLTEEEAETVIKP